MPRVLKPKRKHVAAGLTIGTIICSVLAVAITLSGHRPSGADATRPPDQVVFVVNRCGQVITDEHGDPKPVTLPQTPPRQDSPLQGGVYDNLEPLPEETQLVVPRPADPAYVATSNVKC